MKAFKLILCVGLFSASGAFAAGSKPGPQLNSNSVIEAFRKCWKPGKPPDRAAVKVEVDKLKAKMKLPVKGGNHR